MLKTHFGKTLLMDKQREREEVLQYSQIFYGIPETKSVVVFPPPCAGHSDYTSSTSALLDLQCSPAPSGLLVL